MTQPVPAAMLVICGPSGVGKDTLANRLKAERPELSKVITTTTRSPRDGEINGVSYHFLDHEEFEKNRARGDFLESANVHGKLYGTTRKAVYDVYSSGKMPVCILDVQGVKSVMAQEPISVVFITASLETIEKRIRAGRPESEIDGRMNSVREEIAIGSTFECVLENEDGDLEKVFKMLLDHYDKSVQPRLSAYKKTRLDGKTPSLSATKTARR